MSNKLATFETTGVKWKSTDTLGSREEFINNLCSTENNLITDRFASVVFGLVTLYRNQLLDGRNMESSDYNVSGHSLFTYGLEADPINFRTLLLSAFEPHGRKPRDDAEQHIVYLDV